MTIDCQCNGITTVKFSRAIDKHARRLGAGTHSLSGDAGLVFRTAKADPEEAPAICGNTGKKCCGSCILTVERMIQDRGYHKGETLDTEPLPGLTSDSCPFPVIP